MIREEREKMSLQETRYRKTVNIFFILLLFAGVLFRLWKVPYNFHYFDEAYYYMSSYRLTQGDAFFTDDCSLMQFSLVSLYPFVRLYCSVTGGTEGLIVAGRTFFVFVHAVCTVGVYLLLRKKSPGSALCAAMMYFLYAQWYRSELSFYQIFLDMLLLSMLFVASEGGIKQRAIPGGYFFAVSVLACPYIVIAYLLYTALCICLKLSGKEKKDFFNIKTWLYFTLGCAAAAAIFLLFMAWKSEIGKIAEILPMYFSDSTHPLGFSASKTAVMLQRFVHRLQITDYVLLAAALFEAADRKRLERRKIYAAVVLAAAFVGTAAETALSGLEGADMTLRLCILGLDCYLLCKERDRKLFYSVWLFGWLLGICLFSASDMMSEVVLMSGWIMSAMAGVCFMIRLVSELKNDKAAGRPLRLCLLFLCTALAVTQLGIEGRNNLPKRRWELYCSLDYGIGKGEVISEPELVYEQDGLWAATEKVRNAPGDYVLYFSDDIWPYLEDTKRCATFNAWMQTEHDVYEAEKLLKYWEIHPEKKPDAIYISKNNGHPEKILEMVNTENFPVEENERGYELVRPQ